MQEILHAIIVGVLGGLAYAITGLMKSILREPFSAKKFARTLIIGVAAGVTLSLSGYEVDVNAIDVAVAAGATALAEQLIMAIFRAISKYMLEG